MFWWAEINYLYVSLFGYVNNLVKLLLFIYEQKKQTVDLFASIKSGQSIIT